jgi:hypothetical protein
MGWRSPAPPGEQLLVPGGAQDFHIARAILADPNAAPFYEHNGAMRIGEAPRTWCPAACCRFTRSGSIPVLIVISSLIRGLAAMPVVQNRSSTSSFEALHPPPPARSRWQRLALLDAVVASALVGCGTPSLERTVEFARDSLLEGDGFEPSVPP